MELLLMCRKDGANDILNCHQSCWRTWYWRCSWIFVRFFFYFYSSQIFSSRSCSAELSGDVNNKREKRIRRKEKKKKIKHLKSNIVWWRKLFARQINENNKKRKILRVPFAGTWTILLCLNTPQKSIFLLSITRTREKWEVKSEKSSQLPNRWAQSKQKIRCRMWMTAFVWTNRGQLARRWCQERNFVVVWLTGGRSNQAENHEKASSQLT